MLHDETSGRHLRFNRESYELIGRLDGEHCTEEIWQKMVNQFGEEAISQDDIILILTQLFAIDALKSDMPPNASEFFRRFKVDRQTSRQRAMMNPLAIRTPLFDPDKLLNKFMPWVRPLFSSMGAILWTLVVGYGFLLTLVNFSAITSALNMDVLAPDNLVWMILLFILIKLLHEFGHAFAVKMWGGEVHEMGITILVLMPVPYVDASAAWGFRDKRKRAFVGAAGIIVELFIAAIALFIWLAVEPGFVKDMAFNAMMISGISTLVFNANPLLRFDGYYVLQDFAEIPNLYSRSSRYYIYLIQRYLFGIRQARTPATGHAEELWFAIYGAAAFFYRLIILFSIVLFLAKKYLIIGVALGTWAVVLQIIVPIIRAIQYILQGVSHTGQRLRANVVSAAVLLCITVIILFVPTPLTTEVEGVLWVSEQAQIYTKSSGFVTNILVKPGTSVDQGSAIIQLENPDLMSRINLAKSRRNELETRIATEYQTQRVRSQISKQELNIARAELTLLEEQSANLTIRSEVSGVFVPGSQKTLSGRYLEQGDLIGYIVSPEHLIVKTAIPQSSIGLVHQSVSRVEVRFAERFNSIEIAKIAWETPSGNTTLPNRALGSAGGGSIVVERSDKTGLTAVEKIFQVDLALPEDLQALAGLGERAYVRFIHRSEPLAQQWWRSGRQLLLSHLDV